LNRALGISNRAAQSANRECVFSMQDHQQLWQTVFPQGADFSTAENVSAIQHLQAQV